MNPSIIRRCRPSCVLTLAMLIFCSLIFCSEQTAFAQMGAGNNAAKPALPDNVKPQTRPMYVQGTVVVALMGAAVFAVCRSSRRV